MLFSGKSQVDFFFRRGRKGGFALLSFPSELRMWCRKIYYCAPWLCQDTDCLWGSWKDVHDTSVWSRFWPYLQQSASNGSLRHLMVAEVCSRAEHSPETVTGAGGTASTFFAGSLLPSLVDLLPRTEIRQFYWRNKANAVSIKSNYP